MEIPPDHPLLSRFLVRLISVSHASYLPLPLLYSLRITFKAASFCIFPLIFLKDCHFDDFSLTLSLFQQNKVDVSVSVPGLFVHGSMLILF